MEQQILEELAHYQAIAQAAQLDPDADDKAAVVQAACRFVMQPDGGAGLNSNYAQLRRAVLQLLGVQ